MPAAGAAGDCLLNQATRRFCAVSMRSCARRSATTLVGLFSRRALSKISVSRSPIAWISALTCASLLPPRYSRVTLMMPPALIDIVRRIKNGGGLKRDAVRILRELVVRGTGDDARLDLADGVLVQHRAERAGREHIHVFIHHGLDRNDRGVELIPHTFGRGRAHIRDTQHRAVSREQAAEVIADPTDTLNGNAQTREIRCGPSGISRRP